VYVAQVRTAIAQLGLADRVTMVGEVDEEGIARALATADVLVMPSTLEGYGIAATEAIHAGVPVIAARAQGLEEALAPCPRATIFADDEPALAASLARFAGDASLRRTMREAAREAAPRMPTWAACAKAFGAALELDATKR
jgi:glycosyltransferase involved in cell wall biosynthesis